MCIREKDDSVELSVYVQPRSSKNAIAGIFDKRIKIKLTSPPVDGAANELLVKYFSKIFSVAKNNIIILSGEKSRIKTLKVKGITGNEARRILGLT